MAIAVDAIYENGVLKPDQPLPLGEHERVRVVVERTENAVERTFGMLGWTGSAELLERFAESPELDPQEGP